MSTLNTNFHRLYKKMQMTRLITLPAFILMLSPLAAFGGDLNIVGATSAYKEILISAPLRGEIKHLFVAEGDQVFKGTRLAEYKNQNAWLEMKIRELIWQDNSALLAAKARTRILEPLVQSALELFTANGAISETTLQKEQLEYELAVADLQRIKVTENKEGLEFKLAKIEYEKRTVFSPTGGIITKIHLDEGESSQASDPLIELVDVTKGLFIAYVEAQTGLLFKRHQVVTVKINVGDKNKSIDGKVIFISPIVDEASGVVKIKVLFDNSNATIRPGTSATLSLKFPPAS